MKRYILFYSILCVLLLCWLIVSIYKQQQLYQYFTVDTGTIFPISLNTPYYIIDPNTLLCLSIDTNNRVLFSPYPSVDTKQQWIPVQDGIQNIQTEGLCINSQVPLVYPTNTFLLKNKSKNVYLDINYNLSSKQILYSVITPINNNSNYPVINTNNPIFYTCNNSIVCSSCNYNTLCSTCPVCDTKTYIPTSNCKPDSMLDVTYCSASPCKSFNEFDSDTKYYSYWTYRIPQFTSLFIPRDHIRTDGTCDIRTCYGSTYTTPECTSFMSNETCMSCRLWSGRYNTVTCSSNINNYPLMKRFTYNSSNIILYDKIAIPTNPTFNLDTQFMSYKNNQLTVETSNPSRFYFVPIENREVYYANYLSRV